MRLNPNWAKFKQLKINLEAVDCLFPVFGYRRFLLGSGLGLDLGIGLDYRCG